jgi:RNA polymerase sigma factor (sigma-70 family)
MSEDVAQECFLKLLNMEGTKHIQYYMSWIYKVSENIALRKLEKEGSEQKKYQLDKEWTEDDLYFDLFGDLQQSVEQLDKITQIIFYYQYVESYTQKEISEILGITYENVRQKHHRGIKFLKKNKKE